jgi:hypothetical protein
MTLSRERNIAINLVKAWAQEHSQDWTIADISDNCDKSLEMTGDNLMKILNQERTLHLDLVKLVSRIENIMTNKLFLERVDGCTCIKCNAFVDYASPNQSNDTFICFGCRTK